MKVYEFYNDMDHFSPWEPFDGSLIRMSDLVQPGQSARAVWPSPVGGIRRIQGQKDGDFPNWLDPIFSARARTGLADLFDADGEWLPLRSNDGDEFVIYNVLTVIDCVDRTRSKLEVFPSGVVYGARRIEFDTQRIPDDVMCFRVPEDLAPFFMLQPAVDRIDELGLTGLAPRLVWDSEHGGRLRELT